MTPSNNFKNGEWPIFSTCAKWILKMKNDPVLSPDRNQQWPPSYNFENGERPRRPGSLKWAMTPSYNFENGERPRCPGSLKWVMTPSEEFENHVWPRCSLGEKLAMTPLQISRARCPINFDRSLSSAKLSKRSNSRKLVPRNFFLGQNLQKSLQIVTKIRI